MRIKVLIGLSSDTNGTTLSVASASTSWLRASAVARVGGLLAPSLLGLVVARGFGLAIGVFAALLLLAAIATLFIPTETRNRSIA